MGFPTPTEDRIDVDMMYVSRLVRPAEPFRDRMVLVGPVPGRPSGLAFAAQEDDQTMVTVVGMAGGYPPTDEADFFAFVKRAAPPDVHNAIVAAEPLTDFRTHRFPASLRRRYEHLRRFPPGLLVFGDALCSFNPIYGQGMTVAALQAITLRDQLRPGTTPSTQTVLRALARAIDAPWELAIGADLSVPGVKGPRPPRRRLANHYMRRLQAAASRDPELSQAFVRVTGLIDPPEALLRPAIALRVVRPRMSLTRRTTARTGSHRTNG
jgi:hypothetical protein